MKILFSFSVLGSPNMQTDSLKCNHLIVYKSGEEQVINYIGERKDKIVATSCETKKTFYIQKEDIQKLVSSSGEEVSFEKRADIKKADNGSIWIMTSFILVGIVVLVFIFSRLA